jgi:hypothetical protein
MKIKLQARNLWEAIKPRDVTLQEDRMALDAITSAEAWEAVRSLWIGSEVV